MIKESKIINFIVFDKYEKIKGIYEELKKNVGANFEELEEPVMLAEDFAHYQKVIPGVFFYVGTRCKEYTSGLHTPTFNFHEEVLVQAVELYEKLARNVQLGD